MLTKITKAMLALFLVLSMSNPNFAYASESTSRNTEIAVVPSQVQFDVSDNDPSWWQLSGDVIILHTHTQEEGELLLQQFLIPQYIYDEMGEMG